VRSRALAVLIAAATATTGCQTSGPTGPTTGPPAPTAAQWIMPNLVGSRLQQAQDQIQNLTGGRLLITTSHDVSGRNRTQVLDNNWKVCTQNVAPGTPLTTDTRIDFGAVKADETCP
jgi:hypothetical protein